MPNKPDSMANNTGRHADDNAITLCVFLVGVVIILMLVGSVFY